VTWKWNKEKMEWTATYIEGVVFCVRAAARKRKGWFANVEIKGKTLTDGVLYKNADLAQAACGAIFIGKVSR
jgi:hypothetical protein